MQINCMLSSMTWILTEPRVRVMEGCNVCNCVVELRSQHLPFHLTPSLLLFLAMWW